MSALESGHSDPSLRVALALALASALGVTVEELFGRQGLGQQRDGLSAPDWSA